MSQCSIGGLCNRQLIKHIIAGLYNDDALMPPEYIILFVQSQFLTILVYLVPDRLNCSIHYWDSTEHCLFRNQGIHADPHCISLQRCKGMIQQNVLDNAQAVDIGSCTQTQAGKIKAIPAAAKK